MVFPLLSEFAGAQTREPLEPVVASASDEARQMLGLFQKPQGYRVELVAAEPDVANPVAFTIDDRGRIYVCETFRQEQGVTDNRSHNQQWVDADLAAMTVADRIAYHRRLLPNEGQDYTLQDDRVRLLWDEDGDGLVDQSRVFANGFNQLEDGTGAGVLVVGEDVWFTCIPHLWRLRDTDRDGHADEREARHSGFGVRVAFRGHDMHGLIRGPDGRLYFSIGDRGYHVETAGPVSLSNPESGAVFRCQPDGSQLEVVATGLRNPQELAFDQYGNLFTGDNNSDSGDRARWVYVLPGADSGWRMSYQYLPDRGPFNRERIWHPFHDSQPAFILPPVANFGDGPSGIAYYPGTGLGKDFDHRFLMCDFRGGQSASGLRSFRMQPKGAFFDLVDEQQPFWNILATDLAFGPDGYLYVSDWVNGWVGEGKGRIYRFADPEAVADSVVRDVSTKLASAVESLSPLTLASWLGHQDQRVRLKAQYELAHRGARDLLWNAASRGNSQMERLHGMWGLWQIGLTDETLLPIDGWQVFYSDADPEVRAQAARIAGDLRWSGHVSSLLKLVLDDAPRVQMMASIAIAGLELSAEEQPVVLDRLIKVLADNQNRDPALRHAAIMGLTAVDPEAVIRATIDSESVSVRRAAVVVLRKRNDHRVRLFLKDPSVQVVEEVSRAIYDLPLSEAMGDLAASVLNHPDSSEFTRRAMNACYRAGTKQDAERLCQLALDQGFPLEFRVRAISLLGAWGERRNRDEVLGMWRPREAHSPIIAAERLEASFSDLIGLPEVELKTAVVAAASRLSPRGIAEIAVEFVQDGGQPAELRSAALEATRTLAPDRFVALAEKAMTSEQVPLRIVARRLLVEAGNAVVIPDVLAALDSADRVERQSAYGLIAGMEDPRVIKALEAKMSQLLEDRIPADTRLDVRVAAEQCAPHSPAIEAALSVYRKRWDGQSPSARYHDALVGGDRSAGRTLFYERTALSCLRCHRIGLDGGIVGPNLSDVGLLRTREQLLQSIVEPNAVITDRFGTVVVVDESGKTTSGILHFENQDILRLVTAEGELVTLPQDTLLDRRDGASAMPADLIQQLTEMELRDLVEFLANQQSARQADVESLEIDSGDGDPPTQAESDK